MKKAMIVAAMAVIASALGTMAADDAATTRKHQAGPRGDAPRMRMPLIAALDANSDGVIDADEIANAPAALKKLDKNGDGKLTREELMPPRPEGAGPGPGAPRRGKEGGQKPAE